MPILEIILDKDIKQIKYSNATSIIISQSHLATLIHFHMYDMQHSSLFPQINSSFHIDKRKKEEEKTPPSTRKKTES